MIYNYKHLCPHSLSTRPLLSTPTKDHCAKQTLVTICPSVHARDHSQQALLEQRGLRPNTLPKVHETFEQDKRLFLLCLCLGGFLSVCSKRIFISILPSIIPLYSSSSFFSLSPTTFLFCFLAQHPPATPAPGPLASSSGWCPPGDSPRPPRGPRATHGAPIRRGWWC